MSTSVVSSDVEAYQIDEGGINVCAFTQLLESGSYQLRLTWCPLTEF